MFEEVKELRKINIDFLKSYKPSYRALLNLYRIKLLNPDVVKDYLAFLVELNKEQEDIVIAVLISENEKSFEYYLERLESQEQSHAKHESIWLILKWFQTKSLLPRGFDLVELCNDLVVHFQFPELEKKVLYKSLSDWHLLEREILTYLDEYHN
jgi:hypothetical protein